MDNILNFARLYKNDVYSDVEFVLRDRDGNRVKIPAHRLVLMVRSSVFERMFYGDLKEDRTVTIVDVSAEAFAEFLQLFYLTKVELTTDNIGEVLKLIDKYDASGLWPVCEAFMDKTLTEVTAYEYYELARCHSTWAMTSKINLRSCFAKIANWSSAQAMESKRMCWCCRTFWHRTN